MADVFISYKREERGEVERLATGLRGLGLSVWFDASLSAGETFSDQIDREVRAAKIVLVCWSPAAAGSQWVKAEAHVGFTNGNLISARIAGPDRFEPPVPFNALHMEDLRGWVQSPSARDPAWKSVLRRAGALSGRADIADWGALAPDADVTAVQAWVERHGAHSPLVLEADALLTEARARGEARAHAEAAARERLARQAAEAQAKREREAVETDSVLVQTERQRITHQGRTAGLMILPSVLRRRPFSSIIFSFMFAALTLNWLWYLFVRVGVNENLTSGLRDSLLLASISLSLVAAALFFRSNIKEKSKLTLRFGILGTSIQLLALSCVFAIVLLATRSSASDSFSSFLAAILSGIMMFVCFRNLSAYTIFRLQALSAVTAWEGGLAGLSYLNLPIMLLTTAMWMFLFGYRSFWVLPVALFFCMIFGLYWLTQVGSFYMLCLYCIALFYMLFSSGRGQRETGEDVVKN